MARGCAGAARWRLCIFASFFVNTSYGEGQADLWHWDESASGPGALEVAYAQADGSASMQVTVLISANSPGGATQPITVSGGWICS